MMFSKVLRRFFIPAGIVITESKVKGDVDKKEKVCKPSELPFYSPEEPRYKRIEYDEPPGYIEDLFRTSRLTVTKYADEVKAYERVALDYFNQSKENADWIINYLQEEDNTMPKAGAIGIGALTGLIFGLRGGLIKKTIYASAGAVGMAGVCYPKEASIYMRDGWVEARKYLTIAYNFAYGVKKEDPPLQLPTLPALPGSFSEAVDWVKSTATSLVSETKEKLDEAKVKEENLCS